MSSINQRSGWHRLLDGLRVLNGRQWQAPWKTAEC